MRFPWKPKTSRQRTFFRAALLALFLVVVFTIPLYPIFSAQVIRGNEIEHSTGPTEILQTEKVPPCTFHLSANQHTLLLTTARFHPLEGWYQGGWSLLDLSQEWGPVQAKGMTMNFHTPSSSVHVFGTTTLEDAVSVTASCASDPTLPDLETELFRGEDGRTYFWGFLTGDPAEDFSYQHTYTHLTFRDRAGAVLYTYDISDRWNTWSSTERR